MKRVIPRAHMASATKIHLERVGLDNFELSPASLIHAVCTSAGDHVTEYAEEAEAEDQQRQEEDKKKKTEQQEEDRAALRRAAGTLDELGPRSSADLARAPMTQRTSQAAAQAGQRS